MLRELLADLRTTPKALAKFLKLTERTVYRWMAEDSVPWHILALLWHETEAGRIAVSHDVGNALVLARGLSEAHATAHGKESARLARLVAIADTGAANDPLSDGQYQKILVKVPELVAVRAQLYPLAAPRAVCTEVNPAAATFPAPSKVNRVVDVHAP